MTDTKEIKATLPDSDVRSRLYAANAALHKAKWPDGWPVFLDGLFIEAAVTIDKQADEIERLRREYSLLLAAYKEDAPRGLG